MALFCLASGFSLEIPLLSFLIVLYFLFLEKISGKIFLQVGLLLLIAYKKDETANKGGC